MLSRLDAQLALFGLAISSDESQEPQDAHDRHNKRSFFQIVRSIAPKSSCPPSLVLDGRRVCFCGKDVHVTFQKFSDGSQWL